MRRYNHQIDEMERRIKDSISTSQHITQAEFIATYQQFLIQAYIARGNKAGPETFYDAERKTWECFCSFIMAPKRLNIITDKISGTDRFPNFNDLIFWDDSDPALQQQTEVCTRNPEEGTSMEDSESNNNKGNSKGKSEENGRDLGWQKDFELTREQFYHPQFILINESQANTLDAIHNVIGKGFGPEETSGVQFMCAVGAIRGSIQSQYPAIELPPEDEHIEGACAMAVSMMDVVEGVEYTSNNWQAEQLAMLAQQYELNLVIIEATETGLVRSFRVASEVEYNDLVVFNRGGLHWESIGRYTYAPLRTADNIISCEEMEAAGGEGDDKLATE